MMKEMKSAGTATSTFAAAAHQNLQVNVRDTGVMKGLDVTASKCIDHGSQSFERATWPGCRARNSHSLCNYYGGDGRGGDMYSPRRLWPALT